MAQLIRADELGEDLEDHPVSEGTYDLRIAKAEYKENSKKTGHLIALMITVEGEAGQGASPINHWLTDPSETDDPKVRRMQMRDLKRFCKVFNISLANGFNFEADAVGLQGREGRCFVRNVEAKDKDGNATGDRRNELRLPRFD